MFEVVLSNRFRKDLKLAAKRGLRLDELNAIVNARRWADPAGAEP